MKNSKGIYLFIAIIFVLFMAWSAGFMLFDNIINKYAADEHYKTDAIVVLTGGRNRIAESIRLLNNNMAEKLFISGVSERVSIKDIENKAGVHIDNPDKVELGYKAHDTIGNALEIKEWIENNNITSVRLVTSNYHLPRSMVELNAFHLPLVVIPHPVYSGSIAKKWYLSWGTFKFMAAEYNKFLIAWLRNLF